jgi:two-component system, cell cycle response regulator
MNSPRPGEGLRPDAAGPLLVPFARSHPLGARDRAELALPLSGDAAARQAAETHGVTAHFVARRWLHKSDLAADSHWTGRLSLLGLTGTIALFTIVAVQLRTGVGGAGFARLCTNWLYDGVGTLAGVTCLARGLRRGEAAWLWIAAGIFAWTFGDLYYTLALQNLASQPFPSIADVGYLGFYLPVFVGLGLLVRSSVIDFAGVVWLDGLIGGFTVCALATGLVLGPVWHTSTGSFAAVATNLAYPAGDALLLALIFCVLGLSGWKLDRLWLYLGGGLVLFAAADSVYLVEVARGTYHYGGWLDLGWPAGFVLLAAGSVAPVRRVQRRLDGIALVLAPAGMALICLAIEVWDHFQRMQTVSVIVASLGLLAVIGRLMLTFREHVALLQLTRVESLSDSLTGLGNRRALVRRLDEYFSLAAGPALLLLFDLDGFKAYNDTFGHGAGDVLLQRLGTRLRHAVAGRGEVYRLGGDEFCILVHGASVELPWVRAAASASLRESGEGFAITCSSGHVLLPGEADNTHDALQVADRRMYAEKGLGIVGRESQGILFQALVERDEALGERMDGVARYSAALAAELGLVGTEAKLVRAAAELHDVGKLALPETILQKPGRLDGDEWKIVQQHTLIGERIIAAAEGLEHVALTVRSTHERWDGDGYPDRLRGEEIPLAARVIAICDAYDAITSERPYRHASTRDRAIEELRAAAGTQFDPGLVEVFIECALPALEQPQQASVSA